MGCIALQGGGGGGRERRTFLSPTHVEVDVSLKLRALVEVVEEEVVLVLP